ncbi:Hypothetical predicted protein [Olea europaea subsp. europaea]|uniref:Uncharacterized protein n=1 Tax=Olea europaea subsp. europaea TaxID=158383 RepID=A0A8S0UHW0_OLEEU|nr:Hypothetical predicted protein [Olea europaea subsp. europaea]
MRGCFWTGIGLILLSFRVVVCVGLVGIDEEIVLVQKSGGHGDRKLGGDGPVTTVRAVGGSGLKAASSKTSSLAVAAGKRSCPSLKPTLVQLSIVPVKRNRIYIRVVRVPATPSARSPLLLPQLPEPASSTPALKWETNTNPRFDHQPPVTQPMDSEIFPEMENFTTQTTSLEDPTIILGFEVGDISPSYGRLRQDPQINTASKMVALPSVYDFKTQEMTGGYLGHQIEFTGMEQNWMGSDSGSGEHAASLGGGDQGLFDLTGSNDQAYWSESQRANHYDDQSPNYLP